MDIAVQHFSAEYGEKVAVKTGVEFAPKFDYIQLEKEHKELKKVFDPLTKELNKLKAQNRLSLAKYSKLMANVNYTKSVIPYVMNEN